MYRFIKGAPWSKKKLKERETAKEAVEILTNRVFWCHGGDLNSRPPAYETSALTS